MDKEVKKDVDRYAGVETNVADNEKVNPEMVNAETRELNDNPRDNNLDE